MRIYEAARATVTIGDVPIDAFDLTIDAAGDPEPPASVSMSASGTIKLAVFPTPWGPPWDAEEAYVWLWRWMRRCRRLKAWRCGIYAPLKVDIRYAPTSIGYAIPEERGIGPIGVTAGWWPADALATLLHELAHLACGPWHGHDEKWRQIFKAATYELTGVRVRDPKGPRYWKGEDRGDRRWRLDKAVTLAIQESFDRRGGSEP